MHVQIQRMYKESDYSISQLYINGKMFCFVLEDEFREVKVKGETRIPAGTYELKLNTSGGMNKLYKEKFPFHVGMLEICNVPNFSFVYIHIGNTDEDTNGCLLVGMTHEIGKNNILSSKIAYMMIYPIIAKELQAGKKVKITMINELIY